MNNLVKATKRGFVPGVINISPYPHIGPKKSWYHDPWYDSDDAQDLKQRLVGSSFLEDFTNALENIDSTDMNGSVIVFDSIPALSERKS